MLHDLYTPQGETLQGIPWDVYPRPQLRRKSYVNLNGSWDFAVFEEPDFPAEDLQINVPFCPESKLSGIEYTDFIPAVWYRRSLNLSVLPEDMGRVRQPTFWEPPCRPIPPVKMP